MGLFRSGTKTPETQKILLKKKNGIEKKESSSWEDDDNPSTDANGKPKFWRLHDELAGENKQRDAAADDPPMLAYAPPPKDAFRPKKLARKKKMMFQKLESVDEMSVCNSTPAKKDIRSKTPSKRSSQKKKNGRLNAPLHSLDDQAASRDSFARIHERQWSTEKSKSAESGASSFAEYQPPPSFTVQNEQPPVTRSTGKVVRDKKSSGQFQTFMHDRIAETFSDDTMDRRQPDSVQTSNSDTQSAGLYSESGFPTSQGGHKFQQIVFDNKFNQIEKVKVAKSDPGASDFSDFIKAAAKLTKNISKTAKDGQQKKLPPSNSKPENKAPKETTKPTAWPKLDDRKRRDTPGYGNIRSQTPERNMRSGSPFRSRSPAASRIQAPRSGASPMRTTIKSPILSPAKTTPKQPGTKERSSSPFSAHMRASSPHTRRETGALLQPPPRNPSRSGSPFRAKSPAANRSQSPAPPHDASTPPKSRIHGRLSPVGSTSKRKIPFQPESFQSISLAESNEHNPWSPLPEMKANDGGTATARVDETRNDVPHAGPAINTTREDWMDRSSSLSFVQSEVSFTPENAIGKDDFGFERDFEGFGDIVTKNTAPVPMSTEKVKKPRAESFDWDTDFHRAASPFQTDQERQGCTQAALSLDEGLSSKLRLPSPSPLRDTHAPLAKRRDPSPMSAQRSITKSVRASSQSQGPQKTPPKAVPTNAILGSMLFRQTQTTSMPDQNCQANGGSSQIGDSRSKDATPTSFIGENRSRDTGSSMFSRKQSSFIAANRSKDQSSSTKHTQHSRLRNHAIEKVPSDVIAATEETASIISSVTEEASSFYKKSFGGKSPRWNGPAQTLLNNYNVKKNHVRTVNNNMAAYGSRHQHLAQAPNSHGSFSRSEEEHINVFLSEV